MNPPVIFLAFANDKDDYLATISRERKSINRYLRNFKDQGLIKVEDEASATLEDIFEIINTYADRLVVFHYGGHAGGSHIRLQTAEATNANASAQGLDSFLGGLPNLRLVFLNGCATSEQVNTLLAHGVKAVIATSAAVNDVMATEFAEQFYLALANRASLSTAFSNAQSFITSKYSNKKGINIYRSIQRRAKSPKKEDFPWGLYVAEENEALLNWKLPANHLQQRRVERLQHAGRATKVNDILIKTIYKDIAAHDPELIYLLKKEQKDISAIKRKIVDCFPTPIGEQLRKLFAHSQDPLEPDDMEKFTLPRLRQIIATYRSTIRFLAFILLSQLWDEKYKRTDLQINEEHTADFNSFFTLNEDNFRNYDYLQIIRLVAVIFQQQKIPYFIEELKQLKLEKVEKIALLESHQFMLICYEELQKEAPPDDVVDLCLLAEKHLGNLLKQLAFLVKYKLTTIKKIEVVKQRQEAPKFQHLKIDLNNALTKQGVKMEANAVCFNNFTDNNSVLFLKTNAKGVVDYLSLSPFIIDEYADNPQNNPRLYLFAYQSTDGYYYDFLNDYSDNKLFVDLQNHRSLHAIEFERFKSAIFGDTYQPRIDISNPSSLNSELSLDL